MPNRQGQSAWPFRFVIATQPPILMAYPNATSYNLSSNGIEKIDYYDTEHYQVTHDFLVNPQRMLNRLLDSVPERLKHQPGKPPPAPARKKPNE